MNTEETRARREAIIDELTVRWHNRDCDCSVESCPKAVDARLRAWRVLDLAGEALGKRGWFS